MVNPDNELVGAYLAESQDHLSSIEADLLEIEQTGANADETLVNKVFRAAHSIKGGAGFFGFSKIQELAHKAENVLDMVRSREMTPTPEVINVLLRSFDKLRDMLASPDTSHDVDIVDYVVALENLTKASLPEAEKECVSKNLVLSLPDGTGRVTVGEFDILHARKGGNSIFLVHCDLIRDVQKAGKTPMQVVRILEECGSILSCELDFEAVGTLEDEELGRIPFVLALSSNIEPTLIAECLDLGSDRVHCLSEAMLAAAPTAPPETAMVAGSATSNPLHLEAPAEGRGTTPPGWTGSQVALGTATADAPQAPALPASNRGGNGGNGGASRNAPPVIPSATEFTEFPTNLSTPAVAAGRAETTQEPSPAPATGGGTDPANKGTVDKTLRVNVTLLESLMNLAGELVLSRNQLLDALVRQDQHAVTTTAQRINLVTSEIQEAIMLTRLQPIGNLFGKFPRLIRDLSRDLNKEIQLDLSGREVEIDKSILEGLSDPLTHMVRNSADHGIERPDVRIAAGKPPLGKVNLRAYHEAGQVIVEIQDDGKGIDPQKVANAAINKGLITAERVKTLSARQQMELIFLPGLSTAEKITGVSGRGVGMDVVKSNIDRLGGKVEIDSVIGQGSRFRIKLPLTLAIIPSLLVAVRGERFAIPQGNIVELIHVPADQVGERVRRFGNADILSLRGDLIPMVRLEKILEMSRTPNRARRKVADEEPLVAATQTATLGEEHRSRHASNPTAATENASGKSLNVAVVSAGAFRYALVVDGLRDTVEIVVKPLGKHLKSLKEYAGATILGDGTVALILDSAGLAAKAGLSTVAEEVQAEAEREKTAQRQRDERNAQSLLLFYNAPGEPCSVPLELVERVVPIQPTQIETVGGRRTMQYRGGSLPLITLQDSAVVGEITTDQELVVILFDSGAGQVGLLAAKPLDVLEISVPVDTKTLRQRGIKGSAIIRDQTTLMLDLQELGGASAAPAEVASTTDRPPAAATAATPPGTPMVLIAEDSAFFRAQVKRYVEEAGYRVIAAEDGRRAWDLLQENAGEVQLAVLDLEMPEMGGLDLTRTMRADGRFAKIPVIVLTALASEEDVARAKTAGVDEYQIKLDKDELIGAVRRFLPVAQHA